MSSSQSRPISGAQAIVRKLLVTDEHEHSAGRWLRLIAAVLAVAAGGIHLAQVGIHLEEDWTFAAFFVVVGITQVVAGLLLLGPRPAGWFWFGIIGSALVIGIWALSRSIGLPFGAEPGRAEQLGMADAAASLFELLTIVVLALWLGARSPHAERGYPIAIGVLLAVGALWVVARATGLFDPDPRATGASPELADRAVVALLAAIIIMFGLLSPWPLANGRPTWLRPLMRGLLGAVVISSAALVVLTLPARGGQNADCAYGPLAEVSGLSHTELPSPVPLASGEQRWMPALLLSACGGDPIVLTKVEPLNVRGDAAQIVAYALLPGGGHLNAEGATTLPPGSEAIDRRPALAAGEPHQLAVRLRGTGGGSFNIDSLRVSYAIGNESGQFGFATFVASCGLDSCPGP